MIMLTSSYYYTIIVMIGHLKDVVNEVALSKVNRGPTPAIRSRACCMRLNERGHRACALG